MNIVSAAAVDMSAPLAVGGTAAVYRVFSAEGIVAKIYNDPNKVSVKKLKHLQNINLDGMQEKLGMPISLIKRESRIVGYTQRYFAREQFITLDNWIEQPLAARLEPRHQDLRFILDILKSLAELISGLHSNHLCIVDLKPANVLIDRRDASVRVIDCDSFCVLNSDDRIIYPAKEVTLGYFEPDALKTNTQIAELNYSQDNYAFGVIAFQLLNNGIHPYQGIWKDELPDYNLETLSKQGIFPYATESSPLARPLTTSVHDTFPSPLRTLFDRTFVEGLKRVSVQNWLNVLTAIDSANLVTLCANPQTGSHSKFKDHSCAVCRHADRLSLSGGAAGGRSKPKIVKREGVGAPPSAGKVSKASWLFGLDKVTVIIILLMIGIFGIAFLLDESSRNTTVDLGSIAPSSESATSTEDLSEIQLCDKALAGSRSTWAWQSSYQSYVDEAKRRMLSVESCRQVLGLDPSNNGQISQQNSVQSANIAARSLSDGDLCRKAVNVSGDDWDSNVSYYPFVTEAKRRQLTVTDCLSKSGNANSPPPDNIKQFTITSNLDIAGYDISNAKSVSLEYCQQKCAETLRCVAFVFDRWNNYCTLKSTAMRFIQNPKSLAGVSDGVSPRQSEAAPELIELRNKRFFVEGFQSKSVKNLKECQETCRTDNRCWGYNYNRTSSQCDLLEQLTSAYEDSRGYTAGFFREK